MELSKHLECKFDLIIVRKIHIPWNPEAGFGSITWTGETFFNESLLQRLDLSQGKIEQQIEAEEREIEKRMNKFRGDVPFPNLEGETIIIADDGMASGFSMLAAVESVKNKDPGKIVVAVPTASESSIERIGPEVDELIALNIRTGPRFAVADAYENWYDLGDEDVIRLLEESKRYRAILGEKTRLDHPSQYESPSS